MAAPPEYSGARPTPLWKQKLAGFWRWWTGELAALLPERIARGSRVPVLVLEGGEVVLVEPKSAAGPAARVALASLDPAQARAAVRALLDRAGESRGRARLRLARDEALVRRVSMPAATEENLAQVVGFEMDRLTPFRAEDVYFDQQVVSRDPAAGQIGVQLAVARRELVDARVARLRELGVSVQGVSARDEGGHGAAGLDLLPSGQRGERESPNERLIRLSLAVAVVLLLFAALFLPAWQKRESIIEMHPSIAKAKQEAEATDALARTLERQVADYNFVQARRHAPPALAYLEDVSRLLPDNTWVQQFDLRTAGKSREVQITGETTSSSKLIEILEQSTLLQNATPKGSVTRGSQPGTERFMIAAETRAKPAPEALPARDVAIVQPSTPPAAPAPSLATPSGPAESPPEAATGDASPRAEPPREPPAAAPPAAMPPATAKLHPTTPAQRPVPQVPEELKARRAERERAYLEAAKERKARDAEARARRQNAPPRQ